MFNRENFQAFIRLGSDRKAFGTYKTAIEAAFAYDRYIHESKRSPSLLNFPGMVHDLNVAKNPGNVVGRPKKSKV